MSHDRSTLRTDERAWDAFVETMEGSCLQLGAWARAKSGTGWRGLRVVTDAGSGPIGAQVLIRRLGPGPLAVGYAPRGPVVSRLDEAGLARLTAELRTMARHERLTHITMDPGSGDLATASMLAACGWRAADAVQHDGSRLIDLTASEERLWSDLRATSRRSVNRARRDGCSVREGTLADLPAFHEIIVETARRSGFIHRSLEAYRDVYSAFASTGRALLLFCDQPDGTPAATKLLLRCGGTIAQPYSGMTAAGAQSRANYLLEWETIVRGRDMGDTTYDMWGRSTSGIAWFKEGFGGRAVDYVGAWDLVTLPFARDALLHGRRAWVRLARRMRLVGGQAATPPEGG